MPETSVRTDNDLRMNAFDSLMEMKEEGIKRKEIVDRIHSEFGIPEGTLCEWYRGSYRPYGRRGTVEEVPELYYVLGALWGDGCTYKWNTTNHYTILVGSQRFTSKYAEMLERCIDREVTNYIDRSKNVWFVKHNNYELFCLLEKIRDDIKWLENLLEEKNRKSNLLFVEGFFDAEGCVKVVGRKRRKTPKICLDVTNTNQNILELVRNILHEYLDIEARYSVQKPFTGKDGSKRQKCYHLRIYKKSYIRTFFRNIRTTKLTDEKVPYTEEWLGIDYPFRDSS